MPFKSEQWDCQAGNADDWSQPSASKGRGLLKDYRPAGKVMGFIHHRIRRAFVAGGSYKLA